MASMEAAMHTEPVPSALSHLRLMQLVSPSLPVGAFTYSQGLEYAIECQWVGDVDSLQDWLSGLLRESLTYVDIPLLKRMYASIQKADGDKLAEWSAYLLATRESRELRQEETNRAKALTTLLPGLGVNFTPEWKQALDTCQAAPYAVAAVCWHIPLHEAVLGYVWGWLENQVAAAIKLVPLGQTQGQQVQFAMAEKIPMAVQQGLCLTDDEIGASAPALGIASALHETQYTRLFRS